MTNKRDKEAVLRFQIIGNFVLEGAVGTVQQRHETASENGISDRTMRRHIYSYQKDGLEGLRRIVPGRPEGNSAISPEIIDEAILLRRQNPDRSVAKIIKCLELEGLIEEGSVKRSTLQDIFEKKGYSKQQIKMFSNMGPAGGGRFQRKNRNDLWQSDSKHGKYIDGKKTYLISFLDDCTRLILHSEFYFTEATESVLDCFKKAVIKYGAPKKVYFDNGTPYKAYAVTRACSKLTVIKLHCRVRSPKSKGKIEKFHQVVDLFLSEMSFQKTNKLATLNEKWHEFLQAFYQTMPHSSLESNTSPEQAFNKDGIKLQLKTNEELDDAFLMVAHGRPVDKSGCVNFQGGKYTDVGLLALVGRKVDIVWSPSDPSVAWVECAGFERIMIHPLVIKEWVPKNRDLPPGYSLVKTDSSRLLKAAEIHCKKKDMERLNSVIAQNQGFQAENSLPPVSTSENEDVQNMETSKICGRTPGDEINSAEIAANNTNCEKEQGSPSSDIGVSENVQPAIHFRSLNQLDGSRTTISAEKNGKSNTPAISFSTWRKGKGEK